MRSSFIFLEDKNVMIVKINYLKGTILYTLLRPMCHSHENAVRGCCREHSWFPAPAATYPSPWPHVWSHISTCQSKHCGAACTLLGAFGLMAIHQRGQIFSTNCAGIWLCLSNPPVLVAFPHRCQTCLQSLGSPSLPLLPCPFILHRDLLSYPTLVKALQST